QCGVTPLMYQYGETVIAPRERQAHEPDRLSLTASKKTVFARPVEATFLAVCPNSYMAVFLPDPFSLPVWALSNDIADGTETVGQVPARGSTRGDAGEHGIDSVKEQAPCLERIAAIHVHPDGRCRRSRSDVLCFPGKTPDPWYVGFREKKSV